MHTNNTVDYFFYKYQYVRVVDRNEENIHYSDGTEVVLSNSTLICHISAMINFLST